MTESSIIFVFTRMNSFVKTDYEILSAKYRVLDHKSQFDKNLFSYFKAQFQLLWFLVKNIRKFKVLYIWFADYHSFLPILFAKIFRKKSFLVLGGYDVTFLPTIKYGSFSNPIRSFCAKYSISNATLNLAVSDNLIDDAKNFVKFANYKVLYTGYSPDKFIANYDKEFNFVLSVCSANSLQRIYLKGVDLIIKTAEIRKEFKFILIDVNEELLRQNFNLPDNLMCIGKLPQHELIKYYQKASVYLQLSLREGLPNSVCEAMLCGCIPVGMNAGGIPIAIGNTGYITDKRDPKIIGDLISQAVNSSQEQRESAREYIAKNFPLQLREKKLLSLINKHI